MVVMMIMIRDAGMMESGLRRVTEEGGCVQIYEDPSVKQGHGKV